MIGCFDLPQTQRERHAVRIEAAVSGEERCVTTLRTASKETIIYQKSNFCHHITKHYKICYLGKFQSFGLTAAKLWLIQI